MGALSGTSFKGATPDGRCLQCPFVHSSCCRRGRFGKQCSHERRPVWQPCSALHDHFLGQALARKATFPYAGANDGESALAASTGQASTEQSAAKPGSLVNLGTSAAQGAIAALLGKCIVSIVGLNNVHGGGDVLALAQGDVLALNEALQSNTVLRPSSATLPMKGNSCQSPARPEVRSTSMQ